MTILFVAITDSVHTARWVNQLKESGHKVYVFPSSDYTWIANDLFWTKICRPFFFVKRAVNETFFSYVFDFVYRVARKMTYTLQKDYYARRIKSYIRKIKPDLVHSLETQAAGYLVLYAKEKLFIDEKFPIWWHTNWGSDIFLFGRLPEHKERTGNVLKNCDYYSCECERDVELAKSFGLKGEVMPIYPNVGGFDLDSMEKKRLVSQTTSRRKLIMLKGYQGWSGRALVGIRALSRAKDLLQGYTIVIYSNSSGEDMEIAAELLAQDCGAKIVFVPAHSDNNLILDYHSQARISIGLGISDAISISVLEAMAMGSFPIQSNTSAAGEWFIDGKTGLLVPPEDPNDIEPAIRRALTDDSLVDTANQKNWDIICERMNSEKITRVTLSSYQKVYRDNLD